MKLTIDMLKKHNACSDGIKWWKKSKCRTVESTIKKLMAEKKYDWVNWLIAHVLSRDEQIAYAIYAARQVLDIFEKENHTDNRPRLAIEAAETYLADKTADNIYAANAAAYAANAAYDAYAAANASTYAAAAAAALKKRIINHGVSLLKRKSAEV